MLIDLQNQSTELPPRPEPSPPQLEIFERFVADIYLVKSSSRIRCRASVVGGMSVLNIHKDS